MQQRQHHDEATNPYALRALDGELKQKVYGDFSQWYTLKEAALVCNSTPAKLYYSISRAKNRLSAVQRGRLWFVPRSEVLAYAIILLERRARENRNYRQAEQLRSIRTNESKIRLVRNGAQ